MYCLITTSHAYCQKLSYEIFNNTGKRIQVFQRFYYNDSTFRTNMTNAGVRSGLIEGGNKSQLKYPKNSILRIDCIAIDDSTHDTIFVKSYKLHGLRKEFVKVEINPGEIDVLQNDIQPSSRLQISDKRKNWFIRKGQTVVLKTVAKKRIKGVVSSFSVDSIVICDKHAKEIVIPTKNLYGLRRCETLLNIGPWGFFPYCSYDKFKKPKFSIVKYVQDEKGEYEWRK